MRAIKSIILFAGGACYTAAGFNYTVAHPYGLAGLAMMCVGGILVTISILPVMGVR